MNISIIRNDKLNAGELNRLLATNSWDIHPEENKLYPTLVANPRNKAFYEKFGFQPEPKGFTAMCIR